MNVDSKRIVVAPLENKTGDKSLDSIGSIAADWLSQGIAQTGLVEVVPGTAALESSRLIGSREGGLQSLAEKLVPKSYTINYVLGLQELESNHPKNTLKIYAKLSSKELESYYSSSASTAWRFNVLAEAHHMLGNYKEEQKVLRQGQKIFPDRRWLLAYETRALAARGKIEDVRKVIEKSLSMSSKSGTPGDVMEEAASELRAHGYPDEAKRIANQAVEWYQGRPSEETATPGYRYGLAGIFYTVERWPEAKSLFESLSKEKPDNIDYIGYLGTLAARRGDKSEALKISDELKNINRPYLFGNHTYWRACIAALLGESQQAMALLNEAFAQGRDFGVYVHRDMDLESLRNYKPFQELLRPKD